MFGMVARVAVMWFVMSQVLPKGRTAQPQPQQPMQEPPGGVAHRPDGGVTTADGRPQPHHSLHGNAWKHEDLVDLRVYVSDAATFDRFDDADALVWHETALLYSSGNAQLSTRAKNVSVAPRFLPQLIANRTGLWAHVYVNRAATSPDPSSKRWKARSTAEAHTPLISYVPKKKVKATKNLLSGEFKDNVDEAAAEELNANATELAPHWKGSLSVQLVADFSVFAKQSMPPQLRQVLVIDGETGAYLPPVFVNEFWRTKDQLLELNETVAELPPLRLDFSCTTLMRWQMTVQMQQSLDMQAQMHGESSMEEVKRMLAETSPWLLGVTALVSVLHTVFDVLAFKNDISFYKNIKSMKGLSLGSMLLNLFFQTVIFLYLLDNDTSWMILFSSGMGLAIEVWKVKKAIKSASLVWPDGAALPSIKIVPMDSYTLSSTKVHDEEAMRYLSMLMYPLVVGRALRCLPPSHAPRTAATAPTLKKTRRDRSAPRRGPFSFRHPLPSSVPQVRHLLARARNAQVVVQLGARLGRRLRVHVRLHHDDPAALHQLQAQEHRAHAVEDVHVQGAPRPGAPDAACSLPLPPYSHAPRGRPPSV